VQITVPPDQVDAARGFYGGVLGLPEIEKPEILRARGGFWVLAGEQQVHVGVEAGVERQRTKAHIAYEVDKLEEWRKRLQQEGVQIIDSTSIPGADRFEFRDPFGNRVELIQPWADYGSSA
jgi:catechol 2,3-dioxygenase-like lactoylglutathione lyase family enzyme